MNAIPGPDAYGQASFGIVERNRNLFGDPVMAYAKSFLYYVNPVRLFELVEALNCGESRPFSRVADELRVEESQLDTDEMPDQAMATVSLSAKSALRLTNAENARLRLSTQRRFNGL